MPFTDPVSPKRSASTFRARAAILSLALIFFVAPAAAETISLACTVTPDGGKPRYTGYIWLDVPTRRELEEWFPAGTHDQPHVAGPYGVMYLPNSVTISDSASAKGKARIEFDRTSGLGTITGGRIYCVSSNTAAPAFPPMPKKPAPPKPPIR